MCNDFVCLVCFVYSVDGLHCHLPTSTKPTDYFFMAGSTGEAMTFDMLIASPVDPFSPAWKLEHSAAMWTTFSEKNLTVQACNGKMSSNPSTRRRTKKRVVASAISIFNNEMTAELADANAKVFLQSKFDLINLKHSLSLLARWSGDSLKPL